jgi:hypothetical protein
LWGDETTSSLYDDLPLDPIVSLGEWHHIEVYFKKSSNVGDNFDGALWVKLDGTFIWDAETLARMTNIRTGDTTGLRIPGIKATCQPPIGQGYWLIDEYEVWDGVPGQTHRGGGSPSGFSGSFQ